MRQFLIMAASAAAFMLSVAAAEALPIAQPDGLSAAPEITLVSGGCGRYAHRGPYGGCRPGSYGFYGRPRPFGFYGYGHPRFYRHYGYRRHFY